MGRRKILDKALSGPENIRFKEIISLAQSFGFSLSRISGSHHIFVHPAIPKLINLQNVSGKAKPYQVRQLLKLVEVYNLSMRDEK